MNKDRLVDFLKKQDLAVLVGLLSTAFDVLTTNQRHEVFDQLKIETKPSDIDEEELREEIKVFYKESLNGVYYAPFDINSKNFTNIPEETEEWFEKLGDLLDDATKVSEKGNHVLAVECFNLLFKLIYAMEEGQEIVFADEYGSWMIPRDGKTFTKAYIHSLSVISTPEDFVKVVLQLIKRDSYQSFFDKVYDSTIQVANNEQKSLLMSEIKSQGVRTQ